MKRVLFHLASTAALILIAASCNKSEEIGKPADTQPPVITMDNVSGTYSVKVGVPFTIAPEVANDQQAVYSWKLEGSIIGTEKDLTHTIDRQGDYFLTFRVDTKAGYDQVELKITADDKAYPLISFAETAEGFVLKAGKEYIFSPDVQNSAQAVYLWTLDAEEVGDGPQYTFCQIHPADYTLSLTVRNEDCEDTAILTVTVVESIPITIEMMPQYYLSDPFVRTVSAGRPIYIYPYVLNADNPMYVWEIDGEPYTGGKDKEFIVFTPPRPGEVHTVKLTVREEDTSRARTITRNVSKSGTKTAAAEIKVEVYESQGEIYAHAVKTGEAHWNKVYDFTPAPGQFVNNPTYHYPSYFITDYNEAIDLASELLRGRSHLSLGCYGGYIIVGFDHSIVNSGGGYDFSIQGNPFDGSSELGIVWVMQDTNGNGLPDDEWYQLAGSEYGKPETIEHYRITYSKPARQGSPGGAIRWSDNQGNYGAVEPQTLYHAHDYYPYWTGESVTFYGSILKHRTTVDGNIYHNGAYDWGYSDNMGEDLDGDGYNHFRISDAVNPDGTPAGLTHIDFIKVHTGVYSMAGHLGEVSTEVYDFKDNHQ